MPFAWRERPGWPVRPSSSDVLGVSHLLNSPGQADRRAREATNLPLLDYCHTFRVVIEIPFEYTCFTNRHQHFKCGSSLPGCNKPQRRAAQLQPQSTSGRQFIAKNEGTPSEARSSKHPACSLRRPGLEPSGGLRFRGSDMHCVGI